MKHFPLLLSVALLSASACNNASDSKPAAATPPATGQRTGFAAGPVEGIIIKPVVLTTSVTASGTLLAAEETELHPEASGRVVRLNLPEGRRVQKGELLLKIFDNDLKIQLLKLQTQLKQAEITENRLSDLLKVKGVSQQEYDLAALEVQNLRNEIDLIGINIAKTELRAPYTGIIGLRNISPGAYVTPASAIAVIRSASGMKLDFAVPEKYGSLLRTGQDVSFTVEGSLNTYKATVQATEQRISAETRNLQVRALVKGDVSGLIPGAFAEVTLELGDKAQALMVPSQAIIPQARDKKVIVSKGGKASFVTVKTGIRQEDKVEITSGIQSGDTIATTGILFLRPDMPLRFSKIE